MSATKYFSRELLEVAKEVCKMSPLTWHKITNPYCGICLAAKGGAKFH